MNSIAAASTGVLGGGAIVDSPGMYRIRYATELLHSSAEQVSNLSLAFYSPATQELVEIDS